MLIQESELGEKSVVEELERLYGDEKLRESMSEAIGELVNPDVDQQIFDEINKLVKNRSKIQRN